MSNTEWKRTEAGIAFLEQCQITPSFFDKINDPTKPTTFAATKAWWDRKSPEERKALRKQYQDAYKQRQTPEERRSNARKYIKRYCASQKGKEYYTYGKGAIANLKANAEKRGIQFSLTQESLEAWWKGTEEVCEYCKTTAEEYVRLRDIVMQYDGCNHQISRFKRAFKSTRHQQISRLTLDRKDNYRGYEISNLAKACWFCNNIKGDFFTVKEMKAMMPRIISQLQQAIREEETSCFHVPDSQQPEKNAQIQVLREVNTTMQQVLSVEQQLLSAILQGGQSCDATD